MLCYARLLFRYSESHNPKHYREQLKLWSWEYFLVSPGMIIKQTKVKEKRKSKQNNIKKSNVAPLNWKSKVLKVSFLEGRGHSKWFTENMGTPPSFQGHNKMMLMPYSEENTWIPWQCFQYPRLYLVMLRRYVMLRIKPMLGACQSGVLNAILASRLKLEQFWY